MRIKVDAFNSYVQQTDSIPPVIKNYWVRKISNGFKSKWIWNRETNISEWETNTHRYINSADIVVIVPTNTVYKEFLIKD